MFLIIGRAGSSEAEVSGVGASRLFKVFFAAPNFFLLKPERGFGKRPEPFSYVNTNGINKLQKIS
jgi:hypothetical protein